MNMNQVTLPVSDMPTATAFYRTLGFTLIVDTPHYARFHCPDGDATFSLSLQEGAFNNGAIIYFEHEHLEQWCESLQHKGIVFEQLPTEQRYLWKEAIVKDPSGNLIKLYWAGSNRVHPPWRVEQPA
ncbi:MAG: VOC family protein [Pseudomonadota bacterium]